MLNLLFDLALLLTLLSSSSLLLLVCYTFFFFTVSRPLSRCFVNMTDMLAKCSCRLYDFNSCAKNTFHIVLHCRLCLCSFVCLYRFSIACLPALSLFLCPSVCLSAYSQYQKINATHNTNHRIY